MTHISINSQNICEISWEELSREEWDGYFNQIPRSTLLQSAPYGDAIALHNFQRIRRGLILIAGETAGLVQILEAGIIRNAVHGVILDRGPLWFDGFGSADDFAAFLLEFRKIFPKRFGRRVRFIPEIEKSVEIFNILKAHGFGQIGVSGYQTVWMDLRHDYEVLRRKLHSNWRNKLVRAEKSGIKIAWDMSGRDLFWALEQSAQDQKKRNYAGASQKLITMMAAQFLKGENLLVGTAYVDNSPIAAIVVFIHGSSATYQLGYTSLLGREKCAHHLLLWNALAVLKERSVNDFDLGGVNEESAQNIKTFKEGLGGKFYETPGMFC